MKHKKLLIAFLMTLAFLLLFSFLLYRLLAQEQPARVYSISVLVRGQSSDSWTNVRQGAEQAASERNVDLSFITLSEENNLNEQIFLLNREVEGGANAIVLSAASFEGLFEPLSRISNKLPIVCIESPADSSTVVSCIAADDYQMGQMLGQRMISTHFVRQLRVAVLDTSPNCENITQRRQGLLDQFSEQEQFEFLQLWPLSNNREMAAKELAENLSAQHINVLVALEPYALELAALAIQDTSEKIELYGIGNSGRIASFIEQDVITATIIQNDFGIGYLGVKAAFDALEGDMASVPVTVEHRLITSSNMYDPENQRLLFPFIR
ncbi:MAG: substrate-binding domain-containing protein [Anaerotruncus sp.]|nr:substrate-binding domain-containing protein [Anaerotruncus sp.]